MNHATRDCDDRGSVGGFDPCRNLLPGVNLSLLSRTGVPTSSSRSLEVSASLAQPNVSSSSDPQSPSVDCRQQVDLPTVAGACAWTLLGQAGAILDPRLRSVASLVTSTRPDDWANLVNPSGSDAEESLLQSALRLARHPEPKSAMQPFDLDLMREIWSILATEAPKPIAALADAALTRTATKDVQARPASEPTPRLIGKYLLLELIAIGASGSVFRGQHRDNGHIGAVKLLRLDSWSPNSVARFRHEAHIVAKLDHPSVVRILDSGVDDFGGLAIPYLVTDLVMGTPFASSLAGQPTRDILRTFSQVCDAVAHAHARGVVHRDLKSSNVLVDAQGTPHVLDFGVAYVLGSERTTQTGGIVGTPGVMSPEQASEGIIDETSEVWSLGCLLFEALTQQLPHDLDGVSIASSMRIVAENQPRRLLSLRPDLDADVAAVVDKALSFVRHGRYLSASLLREDVERLLSGRAVQARPESVLEAIGRLSRRHRVFFVGSATALAALLIVSFAVTWLWQKSLEASRNAVSAMEGTLAFAARLAETTTPHSDQRALLGTALGDVERIRQTAPDDASLLRIESRLREYIGDIDLRAGDVARALLNRQLVYRLETKLAELPNAEPRALPRAIVKLGDLDKLAKADQANKQYLIAHDLLLTLTCSAQCTDEAIDDLGWSYERLANAAMTRGDHGRARHLLASRTEIASRLLAAMPTTLRRYALANALALEAINLEEGARKQGNTGTVDTQLLELRTRACENAASAVAEDPMRLAYLNCALALHQQRAFHLIRSGDPQGSLEALQRALPWAIRVRDLLGDQDASRNQLSQLLYRIAECHDALAQPVRAQSARESARQALR
jgi:hypothetical protein